jgi:hypothetical protein
MSPWHPVCLQSIIMPARVRFLDGHHIRLEEPLRAKVENLARLAGVRPADIVNYVLGEVLTDDSELPSPEPPAPPAPSRVTPAPRAPADVIPIDRRRAPAPRAQGGGGLHCDDLRHQAAETRRLARLTRARAADACDSAGRARARAEETLQAVRSFV